MHRCLAWEIDDNVYQGETFAVRAIHTKIIILNTTDCIRFDMLQIDFLNVFSIKYFGVFTENVLISKALNLF